MISVLCPHLSGRRILWWSRGQRCSTNKNIDCNVNRLHVTLMADVETMVCLCCVDMCVDESKEDVLLSKMHVDLKCTPIMKYGRVRYYTCRSIYSNKVYVRDIISDEYSVSAHVTARGLEFTVYYIYDLLKDEYTYPVRQQEFVRACQSNYVYNVCERVDDLRKTACVDLRHVFDNAPEYNEILMHAYDDITKYLMHTHKHTDFIVRNTHLLDCWSENMYEMLHIMLDVGLGSVAQCISCECCFRVGDPLDVSKYLPRHILYSYPFTTFLVEASDATRPLEKNTDEKGILNVHRVSRLLSNKMRVDIRGAAVDVSNSLLDDDDSDDEVILPSNSNWLRYVDTRNANNDNIYILHGHSKTLPAICESALADTPDDTHESSVAFIALLNIFDAAIHGVLDAIE